MPVRLVAVSAMDEHTIFFIDDVRTKYVHEATNKVKVVAG